MNPVLAIPIGTLFGLTVAGVIASLIKLASWIADRPGQLRQIEALQMTLNTLTARNEANLQP